VVFGLPRQVIMKQNFEDIAEKDGCYPSQAVKFVYEGLAYTAKKSLSEPSHVTGQSLCMGLRSLAIEKWGRLAIAVLESWNITTTRDFGEIVYLMVRHKLMSTQPTDSIDDFDDVYDFDTVFKKQFKF